MGSEYLFPDLLELREAAEVLLKECSAQFSLDKTDFVFLVHQGYQFLFFDVQDADPAIFHFEEWEQEPKQVFNHFSEWLLASVSDDIDVFKSLRGEW